MDLIYTVPECIIYQYWLFKNVSTNNIYTVFLVSEGQHPVSAQSELHPAPAFQSGHFQCWLSQWDIPPHPGTTGSAAAPNPSNRGRCCCYRGPCWQIWVAHTRRRSHFRHGGLEDHSAAFQPRSCLFRQVKQRKSDYQIFFHWLDSFPWWHSCRYWYCKAKSALVSTYMDFSQSRTAMWDIFLP